MGGGGSWQAGRWRPVTSIVDSDSVIEYFLRRATVPRSGSKSASIVSVRTRTSRMNVIACTRAATSSGSTSVARPPTVASMNALSSERRSITLVCRCWVYANFHFVTHVDSACFTGFASSLSQPRVADVESAPMSKAWRRYRSICSSKSARAGSGVGASAPPNEDALPSSFGAASPSAAAAASSSIGTAFSTRKSLTAPAMSRVHKWEKEAYGCLNSSHSSALSAACFWIEWT